VEVEEDTVVTRVPMSGKHLPVLINIVDSNKKENDNGILK